MDVVFNILYTFLALRIRIFLSMHIAFFDQQSRYCTIQSYAPKLLFAPHLELGLNIISRVHTSEKIVF